MAYTVDTLLDTLEENMMKTEEALNTAFAAIRTGKASPALVENITFEYYGTQTRIRDAAGITAPEPRLLVIQPWDATAVKAIEKALLSSNIGITPMSDGKTLKLPIPELSQDRRTALSKQAKASAEDAKVALRNIRRDANDAVKKFEKDGELTEDERKKMLDDVQKTTDSYIAKVDAMYSAKEKELMTV
ncbi:MAG: ribosome recycling factor [Lentisphaeria bacterium]|nr:ribosome recycling factor [Lentisphaeria bacterium]